MKDWRISNIFISIDIKFSCNKLYTCIYLFLSLQYHYRFNIIIPLFIVSNSAAEAILRRCTLVIPKHKLYIHGIEKPTSRFTISFFSSSKLIVFEFI